MDSDDALIGRLLSRREVLGLFGAGGLALVVGCSSKDSQRTATTGAASSTQTPASTATKLASAASTSVPSCVVRPALTEGPYFVDEKLQRSDIRSEPSDGTLRPGATLALTFNVSSVGTNGCVPLEGATIDVWHCDALGVYSDATDPSFSTKGQKFLRGYQVTDGAGKAAFTTIYPGWYQGRAVHIHFKIRNAAGAGKTFDFTSQLFFDDSLTDQVHAQAPYSQKGQRTLRNNGDDIFRSGGDQLLLDVSKTSDGYAATFDVGLNMT